MSENEKPDQDRQQDEPVVAAVAGEIDPHGATVVGAVGTEEGVAAVGAIDTDYANTVIVAAFADPEAAKGAYISLWDAQLKKLVRIDGVLAVHTDADGKIHVDQMTEHSTKTGLKWGAVGGLVLGILFPPAIIASTVAWGTVGAAVGKLRNIHHKSQVADQLQGSLGPNQSGILALIHGVDIDLIKAQMPEATKITTAEVDEATAKDIEAAAKEADKEG